LLSFAEKPFRLLDNMGRNPVYSGISQNSTVCRPEQPSSQRAEAQFNQIRLSPISNKPKGCFWRLNSRPTSDPSPKIYEERFWCGRRDPLLAGNLKLLFFRDLRKRKCSISLVVQQGRDGGLTCDPAPCPKCKTVPEVFHNLPNRQRRGLSRITLT